MIITGVTKRKGRRCAVFVDSEELGEFDRDIIALYEVEPGRCCDEEWFAALQRSEEQRSARERALRLLAYRDHSKRELIDKLSRTVSSEVARETAARMEELGFLDDVRYAQKLARQQLLQKYRGRRRAVYELCCKGIEPAVAEAAVSSVEVDSVSQIYQLLLKRYPAAAYDVKQQRKAAAAMERRGYVYGDFRRALSRLLEETEETEEDE